MGCKATDASRTKLVVWGNWGDTEVICLKTSAVAGSLNLCPSGAMLWPGVLITLEVVEEEETQCWGTINLLLTLYICPSCKIYLYKLQNVFVQAGKCICPI